MFIENVKSHKFIYLFENFLMVTFIFVGCHEIVIWSFDLNLMVWFQRWHTSSKELGKTDVKERKEAQKYGYAWKIVFLTDTQLKLYFSEGQGLRLGDQDWTTGCSIS